MLKEKQTELGIEKQEEFARLLGISHSYLSLLYSGKRQPGRKILVAVVQCFPDLEDEAIAYLRTM